MKRRLSIITVLLIATFLSGFVVRAWTNPTSDPPAGNPGEPTLPSKSILFFNSTTCPTGWTEVTSARGRYLAGRPSGGTLAGTAGDDLNNLENRNLGTHTHSASAVSGGHTHGAQGLGGGDLNGLAYGSNSLDFATENPSVGVSSLGFPAGTPAPYIQLLVCKKS